MQLMVADRHPGRGFTLIELMVTIALLSVLLMAVLPDIGSWMRNSHIKSTASAMMAGLATAREQAVRRNRPVRLSLVALPDNANMSNGCALSNAGRSWVVSVFDPTGACAADISSTVPPMILAKQVTGDSGTRSTVTASDADGVAVNTIVFDQFGRVVSPVSDAITIAIGATQDSDEIRPLWIILSPAGDARLCDTRMNIVGDPRNCLQ